MKIHYWYSSIWNWPSQGFLGFHIPIYILYLLRVRHWTRYAEKCGRAIAVWFPPLWWRRVAQWSIDMGSQIPRGWLSFESRPQGLKNTQGPCVYVHIQNPDGREKWRKKDYGVIMLCMWGWVGSLSLASTHTLWQFKNEKDLLSGIQEIWLDVFGSFL